LNLEGVSLRPVLQDPRARVKTGAVTRHTRPACPDNRSGVEAVGHSLRTDDCRDTEWCASRDGHVLARELYDRRADPGETSNLAGDPRCAPVTATLAAQLAAVPSAGLQKSLSP
jgi:iduronate 2-sulfatase